jgi:hypothetical protein
MVSSNLPRRSILASQWFRRGVLSAHAGFGLVPDGCDTSAAGHIDIPRATNQGGELYGPMATTATRRKEGCLPITAVHDWPAVSRDDQGKLSLRQFEIDEVAGGGGPLIHSSYATWGDTTVSIPGGLLDDDPGVRPKLHVFVRSKLPWMEITDGLPRRETWLPGLSPKLQA